MLCKASLDKSHTLGQYYDESLEDRPLTVITNQMHIPGANARGTNFVATPNWVYILQGSTCHALDIVTGEKKKVFSLLVEGRAEAPRWGYIGVARDKLIAGRDFVPFATAFPATAVSPNKLRP